MLVENLPHFLLAAIGTGGLAYLAMVIGIYLFTVPKAKQATQVIAALGFDDAANVGLGTVSFDAKKRWEKEHKRPFPMEQYDEFTLFY